MRIITLQEAIHRKLSRYYTGKRCKHGHLTERVVRNRQCLECARISDRKTKASLKYKTNEKNILRQKKRDMKKSDRKKFGIMSSFEVARVPELRKLLYDTLDKKTGQFICKIMKEPMTFIPNDPMIISFDRLDNSKPHTIDNLQCVSWKANKIKRDFSAMDNLIWHYSRITLLRELLGLGKY